MIDHETAILNDFDPCLRKCFSRGVITNSRLQPHCLRFLCQNIFNVRGNFLRSAKHVYEIDIVRNVDEAAIDLFAEYLRHVGVVNRHRNDLKAGSLQIPRHIKSRLACLRLGFNTEHCYCSCLIQQVADIRTVREYVFLPVHEQSI